MPKTQTIDLPMEESSGIRTPTTPMAAAARPAAIFVPEPENLLPTKRNFSKEIECCTVQQQLSCQQIKEAIQAQLTLEDESTKAAGVAALRAGVLFHYYKRSLSITGQDFWSQCEAEFKVNRATISRKMRLAVIWAREKGADEATVLALANAVDINAADNPAIQLAFDFVGDQTTTDLYRKHKLVSVGPKGGNVTPTDANGAPIRKDRRTQAQIEYDAWKIAANARNTRLKADIDTALADPINGPEGTIRCWQLLDTKALTALSEAVEDFATALQQTLNTRAALARK